MNIIRIILSTFTIGVISYTGIVGSNHGWDLFSVFLGNLIEMNWAGQFNLDFSCYLMISGIWIAWRHNFSISGITIGSIASVGGIIIFAPYLIYTSFAVSGNWEELLLGKDRANG